MTTDINERMEALTRKLDEVSRKIDSMRQPDGTIQISDSDRIRALMRIAQLRKAR